ncbi:copper oxidase [Pedobacter frigiditerrae]|uniref:Copper oxidase n=1 Tax=Pedobacter frigiditerrae TaxID=2530452 RepID=A0A4R0N1X1_9SPHI|nr:multicopper oxidase domain-containing protein [Pedobacter frigiditerrae]TCC93819.1 copper oxidase [Pedobacter frigiditerrae]
MKKLALLLFLVSIYLSGYAQTQTTYACPMHPEVKDDKPSKCPKCGMKLVEVKSKSKQANPAPGANQKPLQVSTSKVVPKTVRYDLYVRDTTVNFTGKQKRAIAVNGQIPMPTLTFTEGDTAEIYVHNELNEETSLHWHGLFVPNKYDGVPNLTQMPIKPHTTHLYKFPIIQSGTHWYHSHTGLQEQIGMYGSMILNKRAEPTIPTIPVILSEWADMNPKEIDRSLHNATDWFAIKKGSTQSYAEAIKEGHFKTKITNEWKRMNAMDVSDVYYDQFLINGKNQFTAKNFKAGDKVRLRISNAGASSYFWLTYAGGKITVVANDGNDVVPVEVDRLMIAVSETYDVIVEIPKNLSYEFLVTPEDRTKSASLWLGNGIKMAAQKLPRLDYFEGMKMMNDMMEMNGNLKEMKGMKMQNQIMDMNMVMYPEISGDDNAKMDHDMDGMDMTSTKGDIVTLNYTMLRAPKSTVLPNGPIKELKFDLTGNMNRYVWTLDNKTVSETDKILIKKGENVRVILYNNSMMRHPMHLHGHDFRLVGKQGDFAPLKNVLDIMPMERDTLEFAATESGDWFFHCHILYHMMSGMGRVFSYENSPANPEIPNPKLAQRKLFADDRMFHFMAENDFASNGNDGMAMFANTRWSIGTEWRLGYNKMHGFETETHIGRYIGKMQWLMPFVGFDWRYRKMGMDEQERNIFGQTNTKDNRTVVSIGAEYTLPMLVKAQAEVYNDGIIRLQLMREDIPISKRLRMSFMVNTDKEYMSGFKYIANKYFSLTTHYDSDMGFGVGFSLNY